MSDWQDLAADWQAQATAPVPDPAVVGALAARARREALAWRWKWRAVQACAAGMVGVAAWVALAGGGTPAAKLLIAFLAALAIGAWWAARGAMDALLTIDARSALDHLRAQRARAAAMPRFVAIDGVVFAVCGAGLLALTLGWSQGVAWFGIDPAGRTVGGTWPLWALLLGGVAYDLWRLARSRALLRRIDALLAELGPAAEP